MSVAVCLASAAVVWPSPVAAGGLEPGDGSSRVARTVLIDPIPGTSDRRATGLAGAATLPRPDDGASDPFETGYTAPSRTVCATHVCVHWVESTGDAPVLADGDGDTVPDQVEIVAATAEDVWSRVVVGWGLRPPKDDSSSANHGPDGRLDIYLADIGGFAYGYTASDDPHANPFSGYPYWDLSTFLVLDDDYAPAQFGPGRTPLALLQVSVAHEFFHAVQAAYDFSEDTWLLEGQATAAEDELYDDVDDLYGYLPFSPLGHPEVPLDIDAPDDQRLFLSVYGTWVYWRFLAERFGGFPAIVRRVLEHADGAPGGPDDYSLVAIDRTLAEQGSSFRTAFARFGAIAAVPGAFFEEGSEYPAAAPNLDFTLSPSAPATGKWVGIRDHLTNAYIAFEPGRKVPAATRLRIRLDLPPAIAGSEATAVVVRRNGTVRNVRLRLSSNGDATVLVPFGTAQRVILVLTNASTRTLCWTDYYPPWYSCLGSPTDDGLSYQFSASLRR